MIHCLRLVAPCLSEIVLSMAIAFCLISEGAVHAMDVMTHSPQSRNTKLSMDIGLTQVEASGVSVRKLGLRPNATMFVSESFAIEVGYLSLHNLSTGRSFLSGFDAGVRWYVFSYGKPRLSISRNVMVEGYTVWSHYFGISVRSRELAATNSVPFSGTAVSMGSNVRLDELGESHFWQEKFVHVEVAAERLSSFDANDMKIYSASLGLGGCL